jgi:hypothetical protein
MAFDELNDDDVVRESIDAISEVVCRTIDRSWQLSESCTLLALSRVLSYLALEHVRAHPDRHAATLATLRSIVEFVEVECSAKH